MSRVIVLRPQPGASETVQRAEARGLKAISIPLFIVEPVEWQTPDPAGFDGLLLTSANAVRMAGERIALLRGLQANAVGKATADAARQAGFDIASSGDAGVDRLLGSLEADLKLLHLCGENCLAPTDSRQCVTPIIVYRSRAVEPGPSMEALAGSVVLVHSPRAGQRLDELAELQTVDRSEIAIAGISAQAAESVGTGWRSVSHPDRPTDDALLALAEQLCDKRRE